MKKVFFLRRVLIISFLLTTSGFLLQAQSNNFIDSYLEKGDAAYKDTAFLILSAADKIADTGSVDDIGPLLNEMGLIPREGAICLGDFSLILMKSFDIPGGIFWSLFETPRYAVRELAFRGIIGGSNDPDRKVSCEEALSFLGRVLAWKEGQ